MFWSGFWRDLLRLDVSNIGLHHYVRWYGSCWLLDNGYALLRLSLSVWIEARMLFFWSIVFACCCLLLSSILAVFSMDSIIGLCGPRFCDGGDAIACWRWVVERWLDSFGGVYLHFDSGFFHLVWFYLIWFGLIWLIFFFDFVSFVKFDLVWLILLNSLYIIYI